MGRPAIAITIATPEDAPGIYALQRQTWLTTYPNATYGITKADIEAKFPLHSPEAIENKRARLKAFTPDDQEWVAKDDDTIVGWAVALRKDQVNELAALYVLPTYQGRRVGARLMAAALDWLGSERNADLTVAAYNRKAIGFYKRWGFQPVGLSPEYDSVLPSGTRIPGLKMILQTLF